MPLISDKSFFFDKALELHAPCAFPFICIGLNISLLIRAIFSRYGT